MAEKIWVDGLWFNMPHEKAPDFVKGSVSIHVERFATWLNEKNTLADENGKIRISLKLSREGKGYAEVDTYKPKKQDDDEF